MFCPSCGFENQNGNPNCSNCGAPLFVICPECGASNSVLEERCTQCGHSLSDEFVQGSGCDAITNEAGVEGIPAIAPSGIIVGQSETKPSNEENKAVESGKDEYHKVPVIQHIDVTNPETSGTIDSSPLHISQAASSSVMKTVSSSITQAQVGEKRLSTSYNHKPSCSVYQYKSKGVAGLLALFLGGLGAHKFYLGKVGKGFLYLIFCWTYIPSIVSFFEGVVYFLMSEAEFNQKYCTRRK